MRTILMTTLLILSAACSSTSGVRTAFQCPEHTRIRESDSGAWCETGGGESLGAAIAWYRPGQIQSISHFRHGNPISVVSFYETGELQVVRSSVPDSTREISRHWYRDGTRKIYSEWENNQLNGLYRSWHPDGDPASEGLFVDGEHEGKWKFWDVEDGSLRSVNYSATGEAPDVPAAHTP